MSSPIITNGTKIKCNQSCSESPGTPLSLASKPGHGSLVVLSNNTVFANKQPVANIGDNKSINIPPFVASCKSMMNPAVFASASTGNPVTGPCVPWIVFPWNTGSSSCKMRGLPFITKDSTLWCIRGSGTISVSEPDLKVKDVKIN